MGRLSASSTNFILLLAVIGSVFAIDVDPKGYVVYCPCMGKINIMNFAHRSLYIYLYVSSPIALVMTEPLSAQFQNELENVV